MARQTRQQRRQRRQQQPALAGGPPSRPLRPVGGGDDDAEPRRPRREEALRRGIPGLRFAQESAAELRKVEWPDQHAVVSGTAVVLIACVIVGAFLWLNDEVWKYVVQHVLLR
jgi:preprotein translocase SecE subunit